MKMIISNIVLALLAIITLPPYYRAAFNILWVSIEASLWLSPTLISRMAPFATICTQIIRELNFCGFHSPGVLCEYFNPRIYGCRCCTTFKMDIEWMRTMPHCSLAASVGPNTTDASLLISWSFSYPGVKCPTMSIRSYLTIKQCNQPKLKTSSWLWRWEMKIRVLYYKYRVYL